MAISFTYGTVGSGKTYDAMCLILDAMMQRRKIVTINMQLRLDNCRRVLLERGMSYYDADQTVSRHEYLWTEQRFRELRGTEHDRIFLVADEAHFWFPQNQHVQISLEDVLQVAMSRKKYMDMHVISQLTNQINREVVGLSSNNWLARPLKQWEVGLKLYAKIAQAFGGRGCPAAFWYVRLEDEMGKTSQRKDGTLDPDNKRIRFLDPLIASCYDTLQVVSSPILDRMRDESKFQYYIDILKGKIRPQQKCETCDGTREFHYSLMLDKNEETQFYEAVKIKYNLIQRYSEDFLKEGREDCSACDARGYTYPEEHPDYAIANGLRNQLDASFRRSNKGAKREE